jgi:hypothetical protein
LAGYIQMILELSIDEINLILRALGELPAKTSITTILSIQRQVNEQLEEKETYDDKDV